MRRYLAIALLALTAVGQAGCTALVAGAAGGGAGYYVGSEQNED